MRLAHTARIFAERGFEVFPLAEGSKMPLKGSAGHHDAVADPIDAYCSFLSGNPNIGLSMKGKLGLDFDAHKGGLETLAGLKDRLPATYVQSTPNGGQHWVYKLSDGVEVRNSVEKIGRGVDVRGAGGHLVGAG